MKKRILIRLLIGLGSNFILTVLQASGPIAVVETMRGRVSQLRPGAQTASLLKQGDSLKEDTSILTAKKSFVKLRLVDGSIVSLGPSSKIVLNKVAIESGSSILSLLKGTLRTQVNKKPTGKAPHFYIKSRTAAMGVRGTEFQTSYNPENQSSSLLTFTGDVEMHKVNDWKSVADYQKSTETVTEVDIDENKQAEVRQYDVQMVRVESEQLAAYFKDNQASAVQVKPGQYSGSLSRLARPTIPVVISPNQFETLYKNTDFLQTSKKRAKLMPAEPLEMDQRKLIQVPGQAPPEGFFNQDQGLYAPKAGGYIDFETGLYIPPGEGAEYDQQLKIFVPKNNLKGGVDSRTGEFIAPRGLKLDSLEGYVLSVKRASKKAREKLLADSRQYNSDIRAELAFHEPLKRGEVLEEPLYTPLELYSKDHLKFTMGIFSLATESENDTQGNVALDNGGGHKFFHVEWSQSYGSRWQPLAEFGVAFANFGGNETTDGNQVGNVLQKSDSLFQMGVGTRYYLTHRFQLIGRLKIEQQFYADKLQGTNTNRILEKVASTRFSVRGEWEALKTGKWAVFLGLAPIYYLSKDKGNLEVSSGFGIEGGLNAGYWLSRNWRLGGGIEVQATSRDLSSTGFTATGLNSSQHFNFWLSRIL